MALAVFHTPQTPTDKVRSSNSDAKSIIESIFGDGMLWAVPKRRVSWERRNLRKHGWTKMQRWSTPKKNIVSCLVCGHWHLAHTICGNCYEKVKAETEVMKANMNEDDRLYNTPKSEVVFLFDGEQKDREKHNGKYIVEMDRSRPSWWSNNLLTKANGQR